MITPLPPAPIGNASETEFQIYLDALVTMVQELYKISENLNAK